MEVTVKNISAKDQLPLPLPRWQPCLIATVYGSDNTIQDAGHIINAEDEDTKWTSQGKGEYVFIELADLYFVKRLGIEWDPDIPRNSDYEINFIRDVARADYPDPEVLTVRGKQDSSLFTVIDIIDKEGYGTRYIKITMHGSALNDTNVKNGITGVKIWGSISME